MNLSNFSLSVQPVLIAIFLYVHRIEYPFVCFQVWKFHFKRPIYWLKMVQWTKHWKQSLGKSSQEIKQCSGPNSAPCITVRICFEGPSGSLVHISSCPSGRKHCDANPAMGFSTQLSRSLVEIRHLWLSIASVDPCPDSGGGLGIEIDLASNPKLAGFIYDRRCFDGRSSVT